MYLPCTTPAILEQCTPTHPFATSMLNRFSLQTQANEDVLVIIKKVIYYPEIV